MCKIIYHLLHNPSFFLSRLHVLAVSSLHSKHACFAEFLGTHLILWLLTLISALLTPYLRCCFYGPLLSRFFSSPCGVRCDVSLSNLYQAFLGTIVAWKQKAGRVLDGWPYVWKGDRHAQRNATHQPALLGTWWLGVSESAGYQQVACLLGIWGVSTCHDSLQSYSRPSSCALCLHVTIRLLISACSCVAVLWCSHAFVLVCIWTVLRCLLSGIFVTLGESFSYDWEFFQVTTSFSIF